MIKRQEVYDKYWQFAAERQNIFFKRINGQLENLTKDPILSEYKFCNVYRASDRVSQFLIKEVIYKGGDFSAEDHLFRIILFRLLNKIGTWQKLENKFGEVSLRSFHFKSYSNFFSNLRQRGESIYGNAFILCANKVFGYNEKHNNHLSLLENIFSGEMKKKILSSKALKELFLNLKDLPLIGNFMAYQIAIDLNYGELFDFGENDFTIAGPGAKRGIRKAFTDLEGKSDEYIIEFMVDNQDAEFNRLGIEFKDLFGRKIHAIDCQGLFCELDKYSRVGFPNLKSNRNRIKSKFKLTEKKIEYFYPPKWGINDKINKYV